MKELPEPVSAILVVLDGERYIAGAINSVLAQSHPVQELIVVDGHSTDRTAAIASGFERVRLIQQPGQGLADARNAGIRAARTEWVAFLDHDDEWQPEKLDHQFTALRATPGSQYSLGRLAFFVDDTDELPPGLLKRLGIPRDGPTPGTLLARRDLFDRVGLFEPRYAIGCDLEWITRVREAAVPSAPCTEVVLRKRLHAGNLSRHRAANRAEIFDILRGQLSRSRR